MKLFTQSASILLACALVLAITITPLVDYATPILGIVIAFSIIYIVIMRRSKKSDEVFIGSQPEVFAITLTVLLAIYITGGLASSLFFLVYFLIFGIVFLFTPETVFVLALALIAVFAKEVGQGEVFNNLIQLGSILLLSPIAYFFGKEFVRRRKLEEKIEDKAGQILEDAETLAAHTTNDKALEEIEDIESQIKDLRGETETEEEKA